MKIIFSQNKLLNSINIVQRAISNRTTLSILQGILIKTERDVVKIVANDLQLGIETYIDAEVIEQGSVVVPSKIFSDIIRKLPQGNIEITVDERNKIEIKSFNSLINLQGLDAREFPELEIIEEQNPIEIEEGIFKDMIQRSIFSVSLDETRPIYTGALFEQEDDSLTLVCLDGYRLAVRKVEIDENPQKIKVVIPGNTLEEVSKIVGNSDKKMSIIIGEKHVLFDLGYTRIISRILEGDFLNYRQIVPEEYSIRVKVDTGLLKSSIERASLIAREGENHLIKFKIREDKMVITSNSEIGNIFEEVPILLEGNELDIAFNGRYFLDILRAIEDDEICLDFTTNINPCVIRPLTEDREYTYLLLPVRVFI